MANKTGFDFDDFGGNLDIIIVKADRDPLAASNYLKSWQIDEHFTQEHTQAWSFYNGSTYPVEGAERFAKALSKELSTKAIYFYYGDASGWMGYQLFVNGEESEAYSFGVDYDEDMAGAGIDPTAQRKAGTIVAHNEEGYQCLFWSRLRTKTKDEIGGGERFIDEFLQHEKAYIGWDLFTDR